ncbi:MAG: hypothetical protein IJC88_06585 [Oscillospiraceae bacterium]|nr:hypothetical protein [Oscillospiraceae bacterium]
MIARKLKQLQAKLELLWFRRWLILSITLLGAVLGFAVSAFLVTPQYTAENELYFSAYTVNYHKTISDQQLENSRGLAESYSVYMKEAFLLERAEKSQPYTLSKHYTAGELGRAIDIRVDSDANVIFFRVTTENPMDSKLICDFYSEFSMREIVELTGVGSYEIFNETKLPEKPSFPNPILFTLLGALLAFALVVSYALKVRQKIYEEKDIKTLIPKSIIVACVPEFK